jgi:hypothetical protein
MPKQIVGFKIRFSDNTPTKERFKTIKKCKEDIRQITKTPEIHMEAWREEATYADEDHTGVIQLYGFIN